jgi:hypothetical protein
MSKEKDTQGIVRTRGEQQPRDKDRAQRVSVTEDGPAPQDKKRGVEKADRDAGKKPRTSGHS